MEYEKILNRLIPADDLYWSEEDQKYTSLSKYDIDSIILACIKQEIVDIDEITKIVNWANLVKVGQILLNNFINNKLLIVGFEDEEPLFGVKKDELREID
jgi:hypothetical protein